MSEPAGGEAEDGPGPRGRGRRYALLALGLVLVAAAAGLGAVVGSWAPPDPPDLRPGAAPGDIAAFDPPSPTPNIRYPLPDFRGQTIAEATAGAQAAGATPVIFDARWTRPVAPDWIVCTGDEAFRGDSTTSTGEVFLAAVPAGDPCP